ncbi:MAG: hypothetical protein U0638_05450 [Phycisphaerales bacterium]
MLDFGELRLWRALCNDHLSNADIDAVAAHSWRAGLGYSFRSALVSFLQSGHAVDLDAVPNMRESFTQAIAAEYRDVDAKNGPPYRVLGVSSAYLVSACKSRRFPEMFDFTLSKVVVLIESLPAYWSFGAAELLSCLISACPDELRARLRLAQIRIISKSVRFLLSPDPHWVSGASTIAELVDAAATIGNVQQWTRIPESELKALLSAFSDVLTISDNTDST